MKDNFSKQASVYAKFRPHYPKELYQHLLGKTKHLDNVWDCGTGNGQVAVQLAQHFSKVYATDISTAQLDHAPPRNNIEYFQAPAENSSLPDHSIDLVTIAQAAHWFDPAGFSKEIKRVVRPQGTVAYWMYFLPSISPEIDETVLHFHDHVLGNYWDRERKLWRSKYTTLDFGLDKLNNYEFEYYDSWNYAQLEGYLSSWSAVQHYIRENGDSPVSKYLLPLKSDWKEPKKVIFPIYLYDGIVNG